MSETTAPEAGPRSALHSDTPYFLALAALSALMALGLGLKWASIWES